MKWAGWRSQYSDWLRAGQSKDRIAVGARFSAPVQTGPGSHPASCTMGTGSIPGVKCGRGVTLTPHPLLVPWSRNSRDIPLLPLWAVQPLQSLSACTVELYLYSPYGLYSLYRASVPVQGCTLPCTLMKNKMNSPFLDSKLIVTTFVDVLTVMPHSKQDPKFIFEYSTVTPWFGPNDRNSLKRWVS